MLVDSHSGGRAVGGHCLQEPGIVQGGTCRLKKRFDRQRSGKSTVMTKSVKLLDI